MNDGLMTRACDKPKCKGTTQDRAVCVACGRVYARCFDHGGLEGARRSLKSHAGLYHPGEGAASLRASVKLIVLLLLACETSEPPDVDTTVAAVELAVADLTKAQPPQVVWVTERAPHCWGFTHESRPDLPCIQGLYNVQFREVLVFWADDGWWGAKYRLAHELAHWLIDVSGQWWTDGDHGPQWEEARKLFSARLR